MKFNEANWRAESDAETMVRYNEIMADSKRKNAALKAAKNKMNDLNKAIGGYQRAFGGKIKRK